MYGASLRNDDYGASILHLSAVIARLCLGTVMSTRYVVDGFCRGLAHYGGYARDYSGRSIYRQPFFREIGRIHRLVSTLR